MYPLALVDVRREGTLGAFQCPIVVSHLVVVMILFTKLACGSGSLLVTRLT
jgi:hypothetical protein